MAEPVTTIGAPIRLEYHINAGEAPSRFLRGLVDGKILGQRCPVCSKVYVPPRGSCPVDAVPTTEEVELANTGTVTTFCVVNIKFSDLAPDVPYVCAQVLLDGADLALFGLVAEMPADEVRMGTRVEAVWLPPEERTTSMTAIKWFRPTGEPDAAFETYKDHL
jgi:uncharacterized protein